MFPKKKRVTKDLFQVVMKNGKMVHGSLFTLRYIPQNSPQFVFVAPKSVAKSAVSRNKLRRQGYNSLRAFALPKITGLFFYKKGVFKPKTEEIKADIDLIFKKAHF